MRAATSVDVVGKPHGMTSVRTSSLLQILAGLAEAEAESASRLVSRLARALEESYEPTELGSPKPVMHVAENPEEDSGKVPVVEYDGHRVRKAGRHGHGL